MFRFLLVALLMAFALAPPATAIDIRLWEFPRIPDARDPHDRFSWLQRLLDRFERDHPGVRVHLTELTWKSGSDKLKIAVYAGAPPDVTSGVLPVKMVEQGLVDDASPFLSAADRDDYLPGTLEAFTQGGSVWGWPWCSVGDLLYVNATVARECGVEIPADGQWSWERFLAAARAMTRRSGEGAAGRYGFGFVSVPDRSAEYGLLAVDGSRPLAAAGSPGLSSPEALRSLERLLSLVRDEGVAPPNSGGMETKDLWQSFFERQSIACAPFGLWALTALQRKAPFEFAVAAFPFVEGRRGLSPTATTGYFVFRQEDSRKRRLCHDLARFLTAGENQKLLSGYGQFPTRRSAGDIYAGDPVMAKAQAIVSGGFPLPAHPDWGRMDGRIKSHLQLALLGQRDAREALEAAGEDLERIASEASASGAAPRSRSRAVPGALGPLAAAGALLALGLAAAAAYRKRLGDVWAYVFLLPSLSIFGAFMIWPVWRAFLLAFQSHVPGAGAFEGFIGFENFRRIAGDPTFGTALANTALYTAVVVPAQIGLGLLLASLLYPLSSRARNFFRAAFYLPGVASVVVLAMVWRWLYDDTYGLVNRLLALPVLEPLYQAVANLTPLIARPGGLLAGLYLAVFACLAVRSWTDSPGLVWALAAAGAVAGAVWIFATVDWAWLPHEPIRWLTSTELSLFSIALSSVLKGPGGALLIYLAAMEAIPGELFEAARSDGAGPLAQWWHVMLPLVRPTTLFLAVTGAIDSFQVFAQVLMLTDGGPAGSSTVLVHQIYARAFRDLEFGEASAMALLLFLVLVTVSVIQYRFLRTDWEM